MAHMGNIWRAFQALLFDRLGYLLEADPRFGQEVGWRLQQAAHLEACAEPEVIQMGLENPPSQRCRNGEQEHQLPSCDGSGAQENPARPPWAEAATTQEGGPCPLGGV